MRNWISFHREIFFCWRHVQRSLAEHQEIFEILQKFPDFMSLDPRKELLRQIAEITHLEICDEIKQPGLSYRWIFQFIFIFLIHLVLPSAGFFLVLKGSVIWQSGNAEAPISSEGAASDKVCSFDCLILIILLFCEADGRWKFWNSKTKYGW